MPKWTPEQNQLLHECAQLGAKKCQELIRKQFGVSRNVEAVRRHAFRIGASISRESRRCPMCGSMLDIQSDGFCRTCHYGFLEAKKYTYKQDPPQIMKEAKQEQNTAKRSYNRVRKEAERSQKEASKHVPQKDM